MDARSATRPTRLDIDDYSTPVSSPKRKRNDDSDTEEHPRQSPIRFRADLPSRPRVDVTASPSPRSKVSRQLHDLSLHGPDLSFSAPVAAFGRASSTNLGSSGSWQTSSPPTDLDREPSTIPESPLRADTNHQQQPATPTLEPTLTSAPIPISPMPLPSPLPTNKAITISKLTAQGQPQARSPESPPPPPSKHQTWSPSEITGHDPTDPTDDGYGINGIGFRPTPAMAHARSQRRKQQVAEWKNREAREARQKRIDRRRRAEHGDGDGSSVGGGRRVRFVDV